MNHYDFLLKKAKSKTALALTSLMVISYSSCSKTQFSVVAEDNGSLAVDAVYNNSFHMNSLEAQFVQPNMDVNETTIAFQVVDKNNLLAQDLLKSDIKVTENGVHLKDFTINKNSVTFRKTVDILFGFDVTGSMGPTIESAKKKLVAFIKDTRAKGYHTRMCLSTFGDYTVQKCSRFYDNDPSDPSTQTQVDELISEISKLKALKGSQDPGGKDLDENPMRNIIDAADAPWGADSQRFMILITDAGYLYSPGNSGAVGPVAPQFTEVSAALAASKVRVFAVTPSLPGYNSPFKDGTPSVVEQSDGEWFKYMDLVTGKITLSTVLNKILSSVNTTFYVNYTIDNQSVLDPSLPLSKRKIRVELLNTQLGTIKGLTITSNLPDGREPDPRKWVLSNNKINSKNVKVYVDDVLISSGYSVVDGNAIEFVKARKPNAKIKVIYNYESLKDSLIMEPIIIGLIPEQAERLKVYVNGKVVSAKYFDIESFDENSSSILFTDEFYTVDPNNVGSSSVMNVIIRY